MKTFNDIKGDLKHDGSLRDFYVDCISINQWNQFLKLIRRLPISIEYSIDGDPKRIPACVSNVFKEREQGSILLKINLGNIQLNCHFFCEDQLELDFSPKDICGPSEYMQLIMFFQLICNDLGMPGKITHENQEDYVIDTVMPRTAQQVDSAEPSTNAVPPSLPSGSAR